MKKRLTQQEEVAAVMAAHAKLSAHVLKFTQEAEIKKGEARGLFYAVTTEAGREWRISKPLQKRKDDLLNFAHIHNEEIRGAYLALEIARMRAAGKVPVHDPESVEEREDDADAALMKFMVPLAKRLPEARNHGEAKANKETALKWIGEVINQMFPQYLKSNEDERRAAELIEIAFEYCQKNDRLPRKKELEEFAMEWAKPRKISWSWGTTKLAKLYSLSGLGNLDKQTRQASK